MFLNGTVEDKRFILQTVISNSSCYDCNVTLEMISCKTWFDYFEQYLLLYIYYKYNFIRIFL